MVGKVHIVTHLTNKTQCLYSIYGFNGTLITFVICEKWFDMG